MPAISTTLPLARTISGLARLRAFVSDMTELVGSTYNEAVVLEHGGALLAGLIAQDDWLPDAYAAADARREQQYLLYCDGCERFSIVSFVWGPGQAVSIREHGVWALMGVLRGAELEERFERDVNGALRSLGRERLERGAVTAVSPRGPDLRRAENAYPDRVSISIHVYGANISAVERSTYDISGRSKRLVSGYANQTLPNLWDRSTAS